MLFLIQYIRMEIVSETQRNEVLKETSAAILKLVDRIDEKAKGLNGDSVFYIIALARKMPRLLKRIIRYFKETGQTQNAAKCERVLYGSKNIKLITEHAIPFVFKDINPNSVEVIVLDDMVVTGNTLRAVLNNLKHLLNEDTEVWTLYYLGEAIHPRHCSNLTIGIPPKISFKAVIEDRNLKENKVVKSILQSISACIAETELPVDLEFPILHHNVSEATGIQTFEESLNEHFNENRRYQLPDKKIIPFNEKYPPLTSYNILLYSRLSEDIPANFIKIRCFEDKYLTEVRIVPFSPRILRSYELEYVNLFTMDCYSEIWTKICESIWYQFKPNPDSDNDIAVQNIEYEEAIGRTKTIMANWLYSLSDFIKFFYDPHTKSYIACEGKIPTVKEEDLTLLVGEKLAKEILDIATEILRRGLTAHAIDYSAIIPILYSSPDTEQLFVDDMIQTINESDGLYDGLRATFALANENRKEEIDEIGLIREDRTNGILMRGLKYFMQFPYMNPDLEPDIHKWIDAAIDLGLVIPKYKEVKGSEDIYYWGRYYFASHFIE